MIIRCFLVERSVFVFLFLFLFLVLFGILRLNIFWLISFFIIRNVRLTLIILRVLIILILMGRISYELGIIRGLVLKKLIIILLIVLYFFFSRCRVYIMYFIFELSLIPIFLIIMGWGYQIERFNASLMIIFYTLLASLPLLFILVYLNLFINRRKVYIFRESLSNVGFINFRFRFIVLIAFIVKTPVFIFHSWLPKAHVEAPVYGSILLASLLLKLGTYGVYLIFLIFLRIQFSLIILRISLVGLILVRLSCLRLIDIKIIIALSSVSHIGIVLGGLVLYNKFLFWGRVYLILAHGVSSSLLFFGAGVMYMRCHSRIIIFSKGINSWIPTFSLLWFFRIMINIAGPPRVNLLSEIFLIIGFLNYCIFTRIYIFLGILLGSAYSLLIFRVRTHGWEISFYDKIIIRAREIIVFFSFLILGFFRILIFIFIVY